ncbi:MULTISPECIES: EpsG family protein [unclassified Breznakia]|uniref:EpsG family protein n=1 Tax=unclassified Breznakia TaxID=2623764 RepID=UPI00247398EA|nr:MULTISPECIES: EpsG family protein [unclassified Breznakia]MDH6366293.1 transmembrane protein EpsG [Breznakia sp. PH1-1]MDH6403386.1 transmembrane protein EpsG [Breznakia sp. PF1-11]MDH6411095.1 transmembrane protein EpsG [Breznakia sp. PFB1-11]MDH6413459.1 transmembrane protein EpsG [Breznakia sp. PFB1-14]MDH6416752.1 transmembrane protein EpsG [Breznakia sp. PFB1-4]
MNIVYILNVFLITWSVTFTKIVEKTKLKSKNKKIMYLLPIAIVFVLITGLRHNMGTDYTSYDYEFKIFTFNNFFDNFEVGFKALEVFVKYILHGNVVVLMLCMAVITIASYFYFFYKNSSILWISIFLFFTIGSYYTSFNTTRQFMAAGIYCLSFKYIVRKDFFRYVGIVLIGSLFHYSCIFMIPVYFLFGLDWNKFKKKTLIGFFVIASISILFSDVVINSLAKFTNYSHYINTDFLSSDVSYAILLRPFLLFTFIICFHKYIDIKDRKMRVLLNSSIMFIFLMFISMKVYLIYRFTYYVLPFSILLITEVINNIPQQKRKKIAFCVILIVFLYSFVSNVNSSYAFFWQNY